MQRERFELSNLPGLQHGSDIGVHVLCSENKKGRPWQRFILYDNFKFFVLTQFYISLIIFLSILQVPENFNEAKFIGKVY